MSGALRCFLPLLLTLLAGCSDSGPQTCTDRNGSNFLTVANEQSGTCGAVGGLLVGVTADGLTSLGTPDCVHLDRSQDKNCTLVVDTTCRSSAGKVGHTTGAVTWSQDSSRGTGTLEVSITDSLGNSICRSNYAATFTRR